VIAIATGMTYREARAMEQTLIAMEQTLIIAFELEALYNVINSISAKKWGNFTKEFARAASILSSAFD